MYSVLFVCDALHTTQPCRVKDRNATRATTKPQGALGQVEKIGYIPRNKVPVLQATGLTSERLAGRREEELDADSAAGLARLKARDADIDQSLGDVLRIVDNLDQIAGAMNEEVSASECKCKSTVWLYACICM